MKVPRSSTETIIGAMRILSEDIQTEDGVANAAIREAADRLEELRNEVGRWKYIATGAMRRFHR